MRIIITTIDNCPNGVTQGTIDSSLTNILSVHCVPKVANLATVCTIFSLERIKKIDSFPKIVHIIKTIGNLSILS